MSNKDYYYRLYYDGQYLSGGFRDTGFPIFPDTESILLSAGFNLFWNDSNDFIHGLAHKDKEEIKKIAIKRFSTLNVFVEV